MVVFVRSTLTTDLRSSSSIGLMMMKEFLQMARDSHKVARADCEHATAPSATTTGAHS